MTLSTRYVCTDVCIYVGMYDMVPMCLFLPRHFFFRHWSILSCLRDLTDTATKKNGFLEASCCPCRRGRRWWVVPYIHTANQHQQQHVQTPTNIVHDAIIVWPGRSPGGGWCGWWWKHDGWGRPSVVWGGGAAQDDPFFESLFVPKGNSQGPPCHESTHYEWIDL